MSAYWITFRIADRTVDGKTYDERYEALKETIRTRAYKWWLKPTSFIAFGSNQALSQLATACKAAIAPAYDLFLIRQMDNQQAIICGANDDPDIFDLMPYLKKL